MKKPTEGMVVDGSCSGNPGPAKYRGIDIATGKELFCVDIGYATNNIAEFLGLCHAVLKGVKEGKPCTIYTDSTTAMAWLAARRVNSKLPKNKLTAKAWDYVTRCIAGLAELFLIDEKILIHIGIDEIAYIEVQRWITDLWGESPADFGKK